MLVPEVTAPAPSASDQRQEPRSPARIAAKMRPVHPCVLQRIPVIIVDESSSGSAILSPEPLYQGSLVQILQGDLTRLAEVRYCLPFREGFRIGLRIKACHHAR